MKQYQNFLHLARNRYSVRAFDTRAIEMEKINQILEAGRIAPSAANLQPWNFIVVKDEPYRSYVFEAYNRVWFRDAPVYLILCADHNISWKRSDGKDHADIDIAIAADHMTLAAAELGLGTCWVCNFNPDRLKELLNIPSNFEPVVILPLGYPLDAGDPDRHETKRKQLKDIVKWNCF